MVVSLRNCIVALVAVCIITGCKKQPTQSHIAVYTALEPEEVGKLKEMFEADHPGVVLDITRDGTGIMTAKLLAEASNPQADVVWGLAATSLLNADHAGMLEPYAPAGVDQISPEFKDTKPVPHWVGIDGYMTAFAVNTAEIAKANVPVPQSYYDLIKPIYKGMISMPNPKESGTGFLTVAGILQIMQEDPGWIYLQQLDQNITRAYTSSGSTPAELAATGECPIGISFDFRILEEIKKGGPLEIVFPKEGSGWEMEANALIKKPNINPNAKIFLDWAISAPAFKYYSEHYGIMANPTYSHPPEGFPAHPREQMIKNNFAWAADNRDRILAEWGKRFDGKAAAK
jgi:iron(III) transport system substrate-binding protein